LPIGGSQLAKTPQNIYYGGEKNAENHYIIECILPIQREYSHLFPQMIITQTNHPSGDFFFVKSDKVKTFTGCFWRLLWYLETRGQGLKFFIFNTKWTISGNGNWFMSG